ncbi:hypothetical protein AHAS_Ahas11G0187600 [Arachis hypogaea]
MSTSREKKLAARPKKPVENYRKFHENKKLHVERQLRMHKLPHDHRKLVNDHIKSCGWGFLERELVEGNEPWVLEFYANYHNANLKSVLLQGK